MTDALRQSKLQPRLLLLALRDLPPPRSLPHGLPLRPLQPGSSPACRWDPASTLTPQSTLHSAAEGSSPAEPPFGCILPFGPAPLVWPLPYPRVPLTSLPASAPLPAPHPSLTGLRIRPRRLRAARPSVGRQAALALPPDACPRSRWYWVWFFYPRSLTEGKSRDDPTEVL